MTKRTVLSGVFIFVAIAASFVLLRQSRVLVPPTTRVEGGIVSGTFDPSKSKPDEEWKTILSTRQYYILRQGGTEVPFTGSLNTEKRSGTYFSAGCDEALFRSEAKYESATGWPSFYEPISDDVLVLREDRTLGATRIEVLDTCGGHLGHVFDDGPEPTGKRYCMNSEALVFVPDVVK